MQKIIKSISIVVIIIFFLSIFAWVVVNVERENKDFKWASESVNFVSNFPDLFKQSVEEVIKIPRTFVKTNKDFKKINKLDFDIDVLLSYSETNDIRSIVLMNLRDDSVSYRWKVDNPYQPHKRIMNPLLLPGKEVAFSFDRRPLCKIDSLSNMVWKQDSLWAHHSLNLDSDGYIWACTEPPVNEAAGLITVDGRKIYFRDNSVTKYDPKTGDILFSKSITEIYCDNGLLNYLMKSNSKPDPIHLNDVQPALKTTKYYNTGDLFISIRQPSLVFQYRPSTNKVIRLIEGPFSSQHDVDFYGDSALVIFNNNFYTSSRWGSKSKPKTNKYLKDFGNLSSNIVKYNFEDDSFEVIGDSAFLNNNIFSISESLQEFIDPKTYFVEEQNSSVLWVIKDNEVIYKNVLKSPHEGYHHLTNWTRVINKNEF